jgi:uncharacterized protein YndB with AHSA1/START domain/uncharacterized glyoxalase superfamily protein PhnB
MHAATDPSLVLTLTRHIKASPERVFAAWTQPELLKQWFTPKPVETVEAELELRPGGAQRIVMRLPDGTLHPHQGVYLEVDPPRRLVATSSFRAGWQPAPPPAPGSCDMPITVELTFLPESGGTRYTAVVKHATVADREAHEAMGFHPGWNQATDQLAALTEGATEISPTIPWWPTSRCVHAYLNFDGRCAEALEFYREALDAQIDMVSRFKDAPPTPPGQEDRGCATPNPDLVMHASFRIGSTVLMASDCHGTGKPTFAGISLSIAVFSVEEAKRVYDALSNQGTILMPLGPTFWAAAFAVVTDRFGVTWMINFLKCEG